MIHACFAFMIDVHQMHEAIREAGITHVVGIPDNSSSALFFRLYRDSEISVLTVTREGEAFATAAGLWIGGKNPVVLIQNTGLLESGDGFRGTLLRMRIPVLSLITYRGFAKAQGHTLSGSADDAELLSRPDLDSVALLTEPTLRAWSLPFDFLDEDTELIKITQVLERARAESRPWALLVRTTIVEEAPC